MNDQFLQFQESFDLKTIGFDEPCISYYTTLGKFSDDYSRPKKYNSEFELGSYISAPLHSQVFQWFRDKHNIFSTITYDRGLDNGKFPIIHGYSFKLFNLTDFSDCYGESKKSYKEVELACLREMIKILKSKNQEKLL
jgi:hypothetical protein